MVHSHDCWRGLSPSLQGTSHRLPVGLDNMVAGFPQRKWHKRKQGRNYSVFYNLALEVILYHFLLVTQISLIQHRRGLRRGKSTRKPRSPGVISEAGYHYGLVYPGLFGCCTYFCVHTAPSLMDLKLMTSSVFCLTWSNNSAKFFHQVEIYLMILADL